MAKTFEQRYAETAKMLREAHAAAAQAVQAKGPEDPNAMDCGFAWVTVDGKSPLAVYCRTMIKSEGRDRMYGDKGEPGWQFWKPGNFRGQAVGHHEAGARAFRDVLAKYGYSATVGSRLD